MAEKITAIRLSIRTATGEEHEFQKTGGTYDLLLDRPAIAEMTDEFIANLFAEAARSAVTYTLKEGQR